MEKIGNFAKELSELLITEQPHHWHKTTQGIISLCKTYDKQIVNSACKRALFYGVLTYSKIKNICATGSYNLPL